MLALAGAPLGLRFLVLDATADACAAQCAAPFAAAPTTTITTRSASLRHARRRRDLRFWRMCPRTARIGFAERVPQYFPLHARSRSHRIDSREKTLFRQLGIAVPTFADVDSRAGFEAAIARIGTPSILKTRRLGYDGKGQFRLRDVRDVDAAWSALGSQAETVGLILEAFVAFQRELSVVAVRGRDGEFRSWPLTENWHDHGILSASLAPAKTLEAGLAEQAVAHARRIAESLDYVGVFALELFLAEGELLANEMAPRVHNSGHWTIEGAETSQFENHLRAVLGLPLGSTRMVGHSCMLNWIGELPDANVVLAEPCGHWHDYGKSPREGRKVGHATLRADTSTELSAALQRIGKALGREAQVAPVIARFSRFETNTAGATRPFPAATDARLRSVVLRRNPSSRGSRTPRRTLRAHCGSRCSRRAPIHPQVSEEGLSLPVIGVAAFEVLTIASAPSGRCTPATPSPNRRCRLRPC